MKKTLIILFCASLMTACTKDPLMEQPVAVDNSLKIEALAGIKLKSQFVTSEVEMNVKVSSGQNVTVKILDIANRVVSKEQMYLNSGDNILKVYTTALPASAYRVALFDTNNNLIGITDFNKL